MLNRGQCNKAKVSSKTCLTRREIHKFNFISSQLNYKLTLKVKFKMCELFSDLSF